VSRDPILEYLRSKKTVGENKREEEEKIGPYRSNIVKTVLYIKMLLL
jgi:hypothetical protein